MILVLKQFPKEKDQIQIFNALILAIKIHIDEKNRLEGQPVIGHVLEVAFRLLDTYNIKDKDILISALLHDSIEDNPVYLAEKRSSILWINKRQTLEDIENIVEYNHRNYKAKKGCKGCEEARNKFRNRLLKELENRKKE